MERVADSSIVETHARFWSRVEKTSGCWIWRGITRRGYGRFKIRGRYYSAHRLAYEWLVGPIPKGMTLDHGEVCSNRACVNPAHVEVVTLGENTARSNRRRAGIRTGWKCGHAYKPENIYERPDGKTECRTCRRLRRGDVSRGKGAEAGRSQA